jgi:hypothetical protein
MAQLVCMNAMISCSFGLAPGSLIVLPAKRVNTSHVPAATIMDNIPMVNVMPFGMCTTQSNPAVAAATAAAMGTPTPAPCIPVTAAPWTPGSATVMIGNTPALNNSCTLNCIWGGVISVSNAGQMTVNVP